MTCLFSCQDRLRFQCRFRFDKYYSFKYKNTQLQNLHRFHRSALCKAEVLDSLAVGSGNRNWVQVEGQTGLTQTEEHIRFTQVIYRFIWQNKWQSKYPTAIQILLTAPFQYLENSRNPTDPFKQDRCKQNLHCTNINNEKSFIRTHWYHSTDSPLGWSLLPMHEDSVTYLSQLGEIRERVCVCVCVNYRGHLAGRWLQAFNLTDKILLQSKWCRGIPTAVTKTGAWPTVGFGAT